MVKIEGLDALKRKFAAMPIVARKEIEKAGVTNAQELVGLQKRLAPHKTGALVASIRYEIEKGAEFRALIKAGGTAQTRREVRKGSGYFTDVAILMEFGTKEHKAGGEFKGAKIPAQPPRPFFFPAWRALKKRMKSRNSRAVTTGIKKVAKGGR